MKKDLLAPPKLTVRKYAKIVVAFAVLAVVAGIVMTVTGVLTAGELAARFGIVAVVCAATIWVYSRLMRVAARSGPERMPLIYGARAVTSLIAFFGAAGAMLKGTMFGAAVWSNSWQIPFMFGWMLAIGGWGRRVGESMHCPHCEYEFKFDHEEDAPIRCPECGRGWLGLLKKGRRVRSPRLIVGGIALAFTGMIVMQPIFYMGFLAPHLPTPLLFASLYTAPKNVYTAWEELALRPLDPKWTRVMAENVLRQRGHDQYESSPSQWFEKMDAAGKIPAELRERFYRESLSAELDVPRRVKAGEEFAAHLRVKHLASGGGTMGLMFGGYFVGDDTGAVGRMHKTEWGYLLRPGVFSRYRDVLEQKLRTEQPGELRVRAVYWVVYQPSFTESLVWKEDGTPRRPVGAKWFERVELEKVVKVE